MNKDEPVFEQIVSDESISELAYNALKTQFEKGLFSPGQKLPSENELARQLNISRNDLESRIAKNWSCRVILRLNVGLARFF